MFEPDKTLSEFLAHKHISKALYYSLKKRGLGPDETTYPGSRVVRISAAAERAWDERMAQLAQTEAAKLEAERRREIAATAGRIAAQSPRHVSRRGSRLAPRQRRA
jgi:hypothetical protein